MTAVTPSCPSAVAPWLRFEEIRVARVDSLENCLTGCPGDATALPLLAVQATFDLSLLLTDGGPRFHRNQYLCAWRVGTCDAEAVARLPAKGLLLPYAMRWDGLPAVGFELCERMSPMRDATHLKKMRVRPLRTYLVLVATSAFEPATAAKCWQKVAAGPNAVRRLARKARATAA